MWRHVRKFNTPELTQRITGGSISIDRLVHYLEAKFGEIYCL
jgi:Zn-dependent M32 family carboxypeptidase